MDAISIVPNLPLLIGNNNFSRSNQRSSHRFSSRRNEITRAAATTGAEAATLEATLLRKERNPVDAPGSCSSRN
ncbi:hypothetical protein L1987_87553 [Smallanthus sonchifolius]|nr:hypothetical protein L1987_87553 [Smallanthus sonchifolius]